MISKCFRDHLRSLSCADRWLLGLCLVPLAFFVVMLYGYGRVLLHYSTHGWAFSVHDFYPIIGFIFAGCAVLVPILTVMLRATRVPRFLIWLWALGVLHHCLAALNYMRLVNPNAAPEGFRWTSEVHVVLRFLFPEVSEGIWIGGLRLALWLSIAVLFIRKCRRLKTAENLRRESPVSA